MRRVALRGLFARKTRLALTALAVALGVTLIAGTYVFTDTINRSFDRIFTASYKPVDVALTPNSAIESSDGESPPIDGAVLDTARAVGGVAAGQGSIFSHGATILGKDGKPLNTRSPSFISSAPTDPRFESAQYPSGRPPRTDDEVALDKATAKREGFAVGGTVRVAGRTPKRTYRISGLTTIAGVESFGGTTVVTMTLREAQRTSDKQGKFDQIELAGARGVTPAALRAAVRRAVPANVDVRTGAQEAGQRSSALRKNLGFLTTALLAFAGIALFVGAFLIFNTFSITVAQRAREFALLRTLGASRGQILRSVLTEGAVLGLAGSAAGLGLGIVIASGLKALFKAVGFDLPSEGTVVAQRTVILSLAVGLVVTMVASLAPALRATRVPPVAALREGVALSETRSSRIAFPLALLLTGAGFALMLLGLLATSDANTALSLVGGGAVAVFLGVALLSPRLVGPLASLVGRPIERTRGITGRLARENTVRHPGRTAVTAAALMIGVALVTFASIFAAGASKTISHFVDQGLRGQAVIQSKGFSGFSDQAVRSVAAVEGVAGVAPLRFVNSRIGGKKHSVTGIDVAVFPAVYDTGDNALLARVDDRTALVSKKYADQDHIRPGQVLTITTPTRARVRVTVGGIIDDKARLTGDVVLPNAVVARSFGETKDAFAFIRFAPGADAKQVKQRIDALVDRDYPGVEALTASEFKDDQAGQVRQLLSLIYALLALAIIVSLFGIVNTLVLSITERTRELGMLRAIGTTRRQVRRMIRYEAVITSLIGGILGLVLGVVLAVLVTRTIDDFSLAIPFVTLIVVLVLAGVAGVLAAVLPARRASRLDVLQALAYE